MSATTPPAIIPVARPVLDEQEVEAVRRVILSGWVTQGPEVAAFERDFAAFVGAPHACAVSNCTTALHLALLAAGVRPGDEVITVSHSFIATASSIRCCGATPVFVDIEPDGLNIDPSRVEHAISPRTRAILCVHQVGMPCDLQAIVAIGRRHGIAVVEDAACAIGSEILWNGRWETIGRPHGDIACFSFHPRKLVTTGDGGMITTNRADWDQKVRLWRQHSMSVPDTVRHGSSRVIFETYPEVGYNYRMTDLQAAVGREQLKRLPDMLVRRRALAARYAELLQDTPGVRLPVEPSWAKTNWQSYTVGLAPGIDQRDVMQEMLERNISTRRGVMCSHREASYPAGTYRCGGCLAGAAAAQPCTHLQRSEEAMDRTIILPLYHDMSEADQDRVVTALADAVLVRASLAS